MRIPNRPKRPLCSTLLLLLFLLQGTDDEETSNEADAFSDEPDGDQSCDRRDKVAGDNPTSDGDLLLLLLGGHEAQRTSANPSAPPAMAPLTLPFGSENCAVVAGAAGGVAGAGGGGEALSEWFAQLRQQADLDLFRVPPSANGAQSASSSSLFDGDALTEEFERHEKTLKDFDEFLRDFCSSDPFALNSHPVVGTEVRPLLPPQTK